MYHIELRQFPHNFAHFNLDEGELQALVGEWVLGRPVEVGERKWSPHTARLKILEGPEIPVEELSLGRGWSTAQRRSSDVTKRVLAAAAQQLQPQPTAAATAAQPGAGTPPSADAPAGDPLAVGVQIAALLGPDAARLLEAWRASASGSPQLSPSEALAQAERSLAAEQPER